MMKYLSSAAVMLTAWGLVGCGKSAPEAGGDVDTIQKLVQSLPDRASNPKVFKDFFVDGSAPSDKDRPSFSKYQLKSGGRPTVSGDTATMNVVFYDDTAGKDVGTTTWTFAKQGDKWKIKTAPLP